ncbi:MAG: MerR family transcriptional regulator [Candidatus Gastranaerophilales bacterium]|nr:MerR family transcriptional regulator [Candidatus Gastranaerophilales bacterium]
MAKTKSNSTSGKDITKVSSLINPAAPIFSISIIATMLGVHQRTLRIYDEEGLLVPKRTDKNRRLYSMQDVEKGKFIQYLTRELGINLAGVRIIFNLLKQLKIAPDKYAKHIQKIAADLNISVEQQAQTRQKLSKRGRKPNNA